MALSNIKNKEALPRYTKDVYSKMAGGDGAERGEVVHRPKVKSSERKRVLVIDARKLRQAGIMHLLETWAESLGLEVSALPPGTELTKHDTAHCVMVIVDVCNSPLEAPQQRALIENVRALLPEASLVIVSDRDKVEEVCSALQAGAVGFLPTSLDPSVALQALSFIQSGGSYFPPSILTQVCSTEALYAPVSDPAPLSSKQHEVFELLRQGLSNKEIARELVMAESTVKVHVRAIMRKLGATNRTQVAISAINDAHVSSTPDA
jgi:DNA-binding NarL/FixJ family response regulator